MIIKGMEWNLKILFEYYKIKEWNGMESKYHRLEVTLEGMKRNHFYNNITIIPLILKNIKNNQWKLIIAKKPSYVYFYVVKQFTHHIFILKKNKYCLTMQTNIF